MTGSGNRTARQPLARSPRLHDKPHGRRLAMSYDFSKIEEEEYTEAEREALARSQEVWRRIAKGEQLDDTIALIEPIGRARTAVMRAAGTNSEQSIRYREAWRAWVESHYPKIGKNIP